MSFIRENVTPTPVTLAVGDGANDASWFSKGKTHEELSRSHLQFTLDVHGGTAKINHSAYLHGSEGIQDRQP